MTLEAAFTDATLSLNAELGEMQVIQTVKPISVTGEMTQPVGVDSEGRLFTAPSEGKEGKAGKGIERTFLNDDYTLTFLFNDGTSYTTPSLRGQNGRDGVDGMHASHSWYGTTLTVVSAAGTSSADLKGDPGKDGAPGEDGYSPTVRVEYSGNGAKLIAIDKNGETSAYIYNGQDGEAGAPGATGPQGPKGEKGDTGAQGPQGEKGDTGAQGPKGDKGDTGSQGAKGDKGDTGAAGTPGADGKSAYVYAKDGGYTGTEAEFAAKLAKDIPTALKNPNALTVNGTSYDGSSAVNMTTAINALIDTKLGVIENGSY